MSPSRNTACSTCNAPAAVRVRYGSLLIETSDRPLCLDCSWELHQDMLAHLLRLDGWILEEPLDASDPLPS